MTASEIKSPFVQMAMQAVERRWCWNIFCPFCGHLPFRYAFLDLANGIYPGSEEWKMDSWPHSRDHYTKKWGWQSKEGLPNGWGLTLEANLAKLLVEMDIVELLENVKYPDCVYILGLGLYYVERAEQANGKISMIISDQLLTQASLSEPGQAFMQEIKEAKKHLTWKSIEQMRMYIAEAVGIPGEELKGTFRFKFTATLPGLLARYGRRRVAAEMLNQYGRQEVFPPFLHAYVMTGNEIILLVDVENHYSFATGFISHLNTSLALKKESAENIDFIRKHGIFKKDFDIIRVEDADKRAKMIHAVENYPVEQEYVANAADWLWSSACKNPLLKVSFERGE